MEDHLGAGKLPVGIWTLYSHIQMERGTNSMSSLSFIVAEKGGCTSTFYALF